MRRFWLAACCLLALIGPASAQQITSSPTLSTSGAWTPTDASGAGLTFSSVSGKYSQVGNIVVASVSLTFPATASGAQVTLTTPVPVPGQTWALAPGVVYTSGGAIAAVARPVSGTSTAVFTVHGSGAAVTNANLTTLTIQVNLVYLAS